MADNKKKKAKGKGDPYAKTPKAGPSQLRTKFYSEIRPTLMKELGLKNLNEVPRLAKIVVNTTTSEAVGNSKVLDVAAMELETITGQKPVITKARKSIANYKLREGMPLGVMVTLRQNMMYDFLSRLVQIALPRVRDFRGINPKSFDGRGNFSMSIEEQIIFPEIDYDKIDRIHGLSIAIVTTANTDAGGHALLKSLGMPFRK